MSAPIVLVHGLCGFDRLFACRRPVKAYFPGLRSLLGHAGRPVLVPRLSPTAGIAARGTELLRYILREVGGRRVHLIGHSLGGLDARYAISALGLNKQVLSLTTVGTPHRGTAFADWGVRRFSRLLSPLLRRAGIPDAAFFDLTTDACRRFNERVPDAPGVRYVSVAGLCEQPWLGPEWQLPAGIVGRAEGPNDGVVSVASAVWGEHVEVWQGDHLNLVNWPNRRMRRAGTWPDRAADYRRLLGRLAAVESDR